MVALGRRKSSPRWGTPSSFDSVPDDILILICCQCTIDELLTLRLTSSRLSNIIAQRISTIAPAVARSTFPCCELLVQPPADPSLRTLSWLKSLIPQQLASILVDRHRFCHGMLQRYGIPAEDPYGNELRTRVANGWHVLRRLSLISKEVYQLHDKNVLRSTTELAWRVVHPARYKFEVFRQREDMILERRLQYIKGLYGDEAKDYKLMFQLLSSTFRTSIVNLGDDYKPWVFDWGNGIDGQRLLRRGTSWLTWFVLHEGPDLFWHQWWTLPPTSPQTKNYIRDKSIEAWFGEAKIAPDEFIRQFLPKEWNDVNEKWHDIQRNHATQVHRAIEQKAVSEPSRFPYANSIAYFTKYAECTQLRQELGVAPVQETLCHVPFHVEFRCPEELFQKFCALRQERANAPVSLPRTG